MFEILASGALKGHKLWLQFCWQTLFETPAWNFLQYELLCHLLKLSQIFFTLERFKKKVRRILLIYSAFPEQGWYMRASSLMFSSSLWPLSDRDWVTSATIALDQWLSGLRLWEFLFWVLVYPRLLLLLIMLHITSEYDLCFDFHVCNNYFWVLYSNIFNCQLFVVTLRTWKIICIKTVSVRNNLCWTIG